MEPLDYGTQSRTSRIGSLTSKHRRKIIGGTIGLTLFVGGIYTAYKTGSETIHKPLAIIDLNGDRKPEVIVAYPISDTQADLRIVDGNRMNWNRSSEDKANSLYGPFSVNGFLETKSLGLPPVPVAYNNPQSLEEQVFADIRGNRLYLSNLKGIISTYNLKE
ncbi:MAG TPA: hypothetical protein VJK51_01730 [Candidatus Nanoarchaeia archaeon]|nr:hypothetical protein [Candidatus Nanoarchaeia archaeon]